MMRDSYRYAVVLIDADPDGYIVSPQSMSRLPGYGAHAGEV